MSQNFELVGIGHPLMDICLSVDEEVMNRYGVAPGSIIVDPEKQKRILKEVVEIRSFEYTAGGGALNTCRAAQWLAGTEKFSVFIGAAGKDEFAEKLEKVVCQAGVRQFFYVDQEHETGCTICLVYNGERSIVANLGASEYLSVDYLQERLQDMQDCKVVYTEGYSVPDSIDCLVLAAEYANTNGKIFALNLSAPYVIECFKSSVERLLPWSEYIFGNEEEFLKFGEIFAMPGNIFEIASQISILPSNSQNPKKVIVTRGQNPVIIATEGQTSQIEVPSIPQTKVLDTTGAGDSFVGGFLFELIKGSDIATCVSTGNFIAGQVIQLSGCTFPPRPIKPFP